MLGNLQDINSVGPNMAIALVTTFYGSVLANWVCIPVATKLKANDATEIMMKEIVVEGLLSIQAGENPRIIELALHIHDSASTVPTNQTVQYCTMYFLKSVYNGSVRF